jgi:hypothetical protein
MLRLPAIVEAKVLTSDGRPVEDLLVSVATLWKGNNYYGSVMGLTDHLGEVRLTRDQFLRDFEEDRRTFPIDFKLPLDECDPALEIIVRGGAEFRELKASIETSTLVDPDVPPLYARARNDLFRTSRQRIDLTGNRPNTVRIEIDLDPGV